MGGGRSGAERRSRLKTHITIQVGVKSSQKVKSSLMYRTRKGSALIWELDMCRGQPTVPQTPASEGFPNSVPFDRPLSVLSGLCYPTLGLMCLTSVPALWFCCVNTLTTCEFSLGSILDPRLFKQTTSKSNTSLIHGDSVLITVMNISISLWPKADKRFPKFSKQSSWCGKVDTIRAVPKWQLSSTWRGAQSPSRHPADLWGSRCSTFQAESHRSKRQTERDRLMDIPCLHWTPPQWPKDSTTTTVFILGCSLLMEASVCASE